METTHRFNDGDLVVLKDIEILRKNRHVTSESLEAFERHYKYMKSKEPLKISYYWEPGELKYSDEDPVPSRRGKPTEEYYYNIQTPRSKLYLFQDNELELYVPEDKPDSE